MKWTVLIAAIIAAVGVFDSTPVFANDVADVVRARANARAGGGTSGHDAWVLKRHGKLSGTRSSRSWSKKKAAKKRALYLAKKKKAAAAKRRAYLLAKKKKQAEKRARIAAKRKAAEKRARLAAKKKKAAEQRALAAAKQEQKKLALVETNAETQTETKSIETNPSYVAVPSTSALMTSHDIVPADGNRPATAKSEAIETVDKSTTPAVETIATTPDADKNRVGRTEEDGGEGCKRFLPAIGLTVSVGCD